MASKKKSAISGPSLRRTLVKKVESNPKRFANVSPPKKKEPSRKFQSLKKDSKSKKESKPSKTTAKKQNKRSISKNSSTKVPSKKSSKPTKKTTSTSKVSSSKKTVQPSRSVLPAFSNTDTKEVKATKHKIHSLVRQRKLLQKKLETLRKKRDSQVISNNKLNANLSTYTSSSPYGQEIIWFSIIVGLVFDFLLWQDVFQGKFGIGPFTGQAERASAILLSGSYAFVCSQLGIALNIHRIRIRRKKSTKTNNKESEIFKKALTRDTLPWWFTAFVLLTILATLARFSQDSVGFMDKLILSLAAFAIGFVITIIGFYYHDIYSHEIKESKYKTEKIIKQYESSLNELNVLDKKIESLELYLKIGSSRSIKDLLKIRL